MLILGERVRVRLNPELETPKPRRLRQSSSCCNGNRSKQKQQKLLMTLLESLQDEIKHSRTEQETEAGKERSTTKHKRLPKPALQTLTTEDK